MKKLIFVLLCSASSFAYAWTVESASCTTLGIPSDPGINISTRVHLTGTGTIWQTAYRDPAQPNLGIPPEMNLAGFYDHLERITDGAALFPRLKGFILDYGVIFDPMGRKWESKIVVDFSKFHSDGEPDRARIHVLKRFASHDPWETVSYLEDCYLSVYH